MQAIRKNGRLQALKIQALKQKSEEILKVIEHVEAIEIIYGTFPWDLMPFLYFIQGNLDLHESLKGTK